jgi:hypothetical protein
MGEIERVQLKFIKMALGVKSSTSTIATYAECGRFAIHISMEIGLIK